MNDPALDIDALRHGHAAALDAFYRAHARKVLNWTTRLGGPHIDPEDVAQDVFALVMTRLDRYDASAGSVTGWLYGITRRVVANARRRAALRRMVGLDSVSEPVHPGPGADDAVAALWRRRQVVTALDRLSWKHREVIVLMDLEERSAPETAELLGCSVGTVYSRLHYARKQFASAVRRDLGPAALHAMTPAPEGSP